MKNDKEIEKRIKYYENLRENVTSVGSRGKYSLIIQELKWALNK